MNVSHQSLHKNFVTFISISKTACCQSDKDKKIHLASHDDVRNIIILHLSYLIFAI